MRAGVTRVLRQAAASQPAVRRCYRRPSRAARLVADAGKRWQDELRELSEERSQGAGPQPPPAAAPRAAAKPADPPRARRAPLQIVKYPSPLLRRRNEDVTLFDAELARLAKEMFSVMYRTDGVGLAAPQVGINRRLMVYNPEGQPGEGEETVLCNPVLVESSVEEDLFEEGCLSFPEIYADVKRPVSVEVEYQDVNGVKKRLRLGGLPARIFQHEFDHLQGVLFHDRMAAGVRATVSGQLRQLRERWVAMGGGETLETDLA